MMGAKRRQMLKREGKRDFCPDEIPTGRVNGKLLEGYDYHCYMEGWSLAEHEHDLQQEHEAEENDDESNY